MSKMDAVQVITEAAVEQARGPVALDRRAEEPPGGAAAAATPLSGMTETGEFYRVFVCGFSTVGDPEAVVGGPHAD